VTFSALVSRLLYEAYAAFIYPPPPQRFLQMFKKGLEYARHHGYDLVVDYEAPLRPTASGISWHKFAMARRLVKSGEYDWILSRCLRLQPYLNVHSSPPPHS
jgi:hypothetical protein